MEELRQGEGEKGSEGRGRTTREHSVHFSDEVEGEQREEVEVATDVVDTPRKKVEGKEVEKEEEEEVERLRAQMQQRERRDSLELVKEVTISTVFSHKFTFLLKYF